MEKKNIVLLIVSSIILIIAIVFAIWSFGINSTVVENQNLDNIEENEEKIQNEDTKETVNFVNDDTNEISQTKDFSANYTDFSVKDQEGNSLKLSDYRNTAVMVLFVNYENEDSVEMLKRVNEQYDTYKDKIKFIVIRVGKEENVLQKINIPMYYDENEKVVEIYNITEFPTMLYINKENEVFNSKTGLTSVDALTANLDILAENY